MVVMNVMNEELFFTVLVRFAPDKEHKEPWVAHAARFHERVQEIGGYDKVYPKTINGFAFYCPDRAVREKLLDGVTNSYADIFGDKERLISEELRLVAYITLVSMAKPGQVEVVIGRIRSAYAGHGIELPKTVEAKIAERERVAAERQKANADQERHELQRKSHEFRKPYLHPKMSFTEKAESLRALGYRLETRDLNGNLHFVGRDPTTQVLVRQIVFGERRGGREDRSLSLRSKKPETPEERARRESERDARRAERIGAQPKKGASGKKR